MFVLLFSIPFLSDLGNHPPARSPLPPLRPAPLPRGVSASPSASSPGASPGASSCAKSVVLSPQEAEEQASDDCSLRARCAVWGERVLFFFHSAHGVAIPSHLFFFLGSHGSHTEAVLGMVGVFKSMVVRGPGELCWSEYLDLHVNPSQSLPIYRQSTRLPSEIHLVCLTCTRD